MIIERGDRESLLSNVITNTEERLRQADYVIDNSLDVAHGEAETRRVYELLVRDLASSNRS